MRMHVLSGGRLRMRRSIYLPDADPEATIELPVLCMLIRHRQGLVLFDSGCHPSVLTDPAARWGSLARHMTPIFPEKDGLMAQLALVGVAANDIDIVVCSHLHPDHCGCNVFFQRATVMAQASEIAAATAADAIARSYYAIDWEHSKPMEAIDGERDLFGDGRITLLPVPGHTPGMMAAHVVLDRDGAFVLASDSISLRVHLDQRFTPRNTWNAEKAMASIEAVARLQRDGATVLFGHDAEQWEGLRMGAAFYG